MAVGPAAFEIFGIGIPITPLMVFGGFVIGIVGGATPGLAGPFLMAISSRSCSRSLALHRRAAAGSGLSCGRHEGRYGWRRGSRNLFNTPGTPDAMLTTFDGYPMAKKGQAGKALKTAHFASVSGDTFSDLVLFTCAPFLAIIVEAYLGFGEKAALILLSLAFVAAVVEPLR